MRCNTEAEMSARGSRTRLIYSALLGALVISCGSPSVSAVPPAPPPAAARAWETALAPPQGGLAQAPESAPEVVPVPTPRAAPPPAPRAAPAPVTPPAPPPAVPPSRPGGSPPGTALVTVPGGDDSPLDRWKKNLDDACGKAKPKQPRGCLKLDIDYFDSEDKEIPQQPDGNCRIKRQNPEKGAQVPTSRQIKLDVVCDTSSTGAGPETQGN